MDAEDVIFPSEGKGEGAKRPGEGAPQCAPFPLLSVASPGGVAAGNVSRFESRQRNVSRFFFPKVDLLTYLLTFENWPQTSSQQGAVRKSADVFPPPFKSPFLLTFCAKTST